MITANSHVHGNGMVSDGDILALARKYGKDLSLPVNKRPETSHIRSDGGRDWAQDHHSVLHVAYDQSVSLIKTPEDIKTVVLGGLQRDANAGSIYARVLSSCLNNCRNPSEAQDVFARNALAYHAAFREAERFGVHATLSVSIKRHLKDAPKKAHELLDCVEAFQRKYPDEAKIISSIDMAGNEERVDFKEFYDVFDRAHRPQNKSGLGLQGSTHCGEVLGPSDIWAALHLQGVKQISHALSAREDQKLLDEIRNRHILVDQLQINNRMLQPHRFGDDGKHPIVALHKAGINLALGSDDPGLQGTNIGHEYAVARAKGLDNAALLGFTANAVRLGFVSIDVKTKLLKQVAGFACDHGILVPPDIQKVSAGHGQFATLQL